jgi:hypothetical protein
MRSRPLGIDSLRYRIARKHSLKKVSRYFLSLCEVHQHRRTYHHVCAACPCLESLSLSLSRSLFSWLLLHILHFKGSLYQMHTRCRLELSILHYYAVAHNFLSPRNFHLAYSCATSSAIEGGTSWCNKSSAPAPDDFVAFLLSSVVQQTLRISVELT